ncbi:hypothetical protein CPC08DRAFT_711264 [Agrocybe pediades]|nr:hypothetical protein CPC08DRAFT_711264 [Agrocybe pediades]
MMGFAWLKALYKPQRNEGSDGSAAEAGTLARSADESRTSAHAEGNTQSLRERSRSWFKANEEKIFRVPWKLAFCLICILITAKLYWKDLTSQPSKRAGAIIIIISSPVIVFGTVLTVNMSLGLACEFLLWVVEVFKKAAGVFWNLYTRIRERVRRRKGSDNSASMPAEGRDVELAVVPSTEESLRTISSVDNLEKTVVSSDIGHGGSISCLKKDGDSETIAMSESRPRASRVHFML